MEQFGGCPRIVRTDLETENVLIRDIQTYLRSMMAIVDLANLATSQEQALEKSKDWELVGHAAQRRNGELDTTSERNERWGSVCWWRPGQITCVAVLSEHYTGEVEESPWHMLFHTMSKYRVFVTFLVVEAKEDPDADTWQEPGGNLNGLFIIEMKITAKLRKMIKPDCTLPRNWIKETRKAMGIFDGGSDNDWKKTGRLSTALVNRCHELYKSFPCVSKLLPRIIQVIPLR